MQKLKLYIKNGCVSLMTLVFFANITFAHSVDFHLCQGELQSFALFGQKASCEKMVEAQSQAPRSCCDVKINLQGLYFKQKSCCDNVQVVQDNLLAKPSVDYDHEVFSAWDVIDNFSTISFEEIVLEECARKIEIPPPPNINNRHSQEILQVFII